jgi:type I restriction enzyme S subunit
VSVPKTVTLSDVAIIERDVVEARKIETGTLYVGLENIESGGRFTGVRKIESGELASSKFAFTPRHLLYGKLRPYLAKIARPDFVGICSTDILPILPGPDLDRGYLGWFLLTPEMISLASSRATGANLPRLSPRQLGELKIPFPPLPEQRRIAEILDKADRLRDQRRFALAQLDALTQSIFVDMFGDPVTNPKGLPTTRLSNVCTRITDGTHQPPSWSHTGNPFLFVRNIITGEIEFDTEKFISDETHAELTRRCPIDVGDVLYSTVGSYGVPAVVRTERKFAFQRHIAHLKPERSVLDSEFLRVMLSSPSLKGQADRAARGVAQKTVNLADIREFVVFRPPLELQRMFSARAFVILQLQAAQRRSLEKLDVLFSSLQHRGFRGEL